MPDKTSSASFMVLQKPARDVRRGDRVWAPNDNDWLLVDRLEQNSEWDTLTVYRWDHSEAEFSLSGWVIVREPESTGGANV